VDSVQVAPFLHGLLLHSSPSMSQIPVIEFTLLSITVHWLVYCEMKVYAHTPLAQPGTHAHEKASIEILVFL
jgi:hypothetical protein